MQNRIQLSRLTDVAYGPAGSSTGGGQPSNMLSLLLVHRGRRRCRALPPPSPAWPACRSRAPAPARCGCRRRARRDGSAADRKSVVSGKSVSVRVDLGSRSILNKKKINNNNKKIQQQRKKQRTEK